MGALGMFARNRTETRRFFHESWRKRCAGLPLEPLEALGADVVAAHPEYHVQVTDKRPIEGDGADPVGNPFLHLGLHVALLEQLQADRPTGIRAEFIRLKAHHPDIHQTEHRIIEILADALWTAQSRGAFPDEAQYLERIRRLD